MEYDDTKTIRQIFDNMSEDKKALIFTILAEYASDEDIEHSIPNNYDDLIHYGVIGMKWGKRKVRKLEKQKTKNIKKTTKLNKALYKAMKKRRPDYQEIEVLRGKINDNMTLNNLLNERIDITKAKHDKKYKKTIERLLLDEETNRGKIDAMEYEKNRT